MNFGRRQRDKQQQSEPILAQRGHWVMHIDTREAAVNLYSILQAFHRSGRTGIGGRESVRHIEKWLSSIEKQVSDVKRLAADTQGPFRKRDLSPIDVSLELDAKERALMLTICQIIHSQLLTSEGKRNWIENQGRADYELAVKNFKGWVNALSREKDSG